MKAEDFNIALQKLNDHIASHNMRSTSEREAVLKAVYGFSKRFTYEDVEASLSKNEAFPVCKATIYNALGLFIDLGFLRSTRQNARTYYDISTSKNLCVQICRVCGKNRKLNGEFYENLLQEAKLYRFTREAFTLTFDGICASCKAKQTKEARKKTKKQ